MRRPEILAPVFIALLVGLGHASQLDEQTDKPAQEARKQLEGPWVEVHALANPKPKGPGEFYAWIFQGDKVDRRHFQTQDGAPVISSDNVGTYTLDIAAQPKAIDIVLQSPLGENWKMQGIYAFEADTLMLCFGRDKRPIAFENKDGNQMYVLKRPPKG